jgi:mannose-6-phosphate isomerase-like protein (cupin superfamily)
MIKKSIYEVFSTKAQNLHNGTGIAYGGVLMDRNDLGNGAWRFIDVWRIPPNSGIGRHIHEKGYEMYLIVEGQAHMTTNDEEFPVKKGDVIINQPGDTHSFFNDSEQDVEILVAMVLEDNDEIWYENC